MGINDENDENVMKEFSSVQVEYILAFQERINSEDPDFVIATVTNKKTGKIHPCLFMLLGEDDIIPIGILSIPGDGTLDDYEFDGPEENSDGSQGKRVDGVDFVYSSEAEEEVEERPGFLKRISQRLLNR